MSDADDVVQSFWQQFPQLHRHADRRKPDHYAWAIDEVLEEYLDRLRGDNPDLPPLTAEEVQALADNCWKLVFNRKKKHRRRREIQLKEYPHKSGRLVSDLPTSPASVIAEARDLPVGQLEQAEKLAWVHAQVSACEWRLLSALAEGTGYEALSRQLNHPVGTLKAQVARCRCRLRTSTRPGWAASS